LGTAGRGKQEFLQEGGNVYLRNERQGRGFYPETGATGVEVLAPQRGKGKREGEPIFRCKSSGLRGEGKTVKKGGKHGRKGEGGGCELGGA